MKPLTLVGVILVVLGVAALAYRGVTYTSRETILDIGPVQATADTQKTMDVPPVVGGVAVLAGVVLLVIGARKRMTEPGR